MDRNEYYSIAMDDLLYLQHNLDTTHYNQIAAGSQQVAEKLLKSILELVQPEAESLLCGHNLRKIYEAIPKDEGMKLSIRDLSFLKDQYFETRYPGDNFVIVTREECSECLEIMYEVVSQVTEWRSKRELPVVSYKTLHLQSVDGGEGIDGVKDEGDSEKVKEVSTDVSEAEEVQHSEVEVAKELLGVDKEEDEE